MSTAVEQIKERLSILDVVGGYVELHKAGRHFKGRSPFSSEKTPSFFVSPERGMYYCFSTNQGGDIFTFIEAMEGVDFKGALTMLAERAGVELVPEDPHKRTEREQLYALIDEAGSFFEHTLTGEKAVKDYLSERGVHTQTMRTWRIGFAPNEWHMLKDHLLQKGYSETLLIRSGLIKRSEDRTRSYDVFRNRVMFPIADASGRIVAFSGRAMTTDPNTPKYVNSPETELYQKSDVLFGYDKARRGIRQHDFSLIVEGQFDLILAHQAGYTNTVAISGTALTPQHVRLLERLSNKVVLALDADSAGISSMKRGAGLMLERGMDVKVARITDGKDPADLVAEDPKLLKQAVGGAMHVVPFLVETLKAQAPDERTFKLRVRDEVLPLLISMPSKIDREHFEDLLATELKTTKDAIHFEVERLIQARASNEHIQKETDAETDTQRVTHHREKHSRSEDLMLHVFGIVLWQEDRDDQSVDTANVHTRLKDIVGDDAFDALLSTREDVKTKLIFEVEELYGGEGEAERLAHVIEEALSELRIRGLKEKLRLARTKLRDAEREGDTKTAHELLETCGALQKQLSEADA